MCPSRGDPGLSGVRAFHVDSVPMGHEACPDSVAMLYGLMGRLGGKCDLAEVQAQLDEAKAEPLNLRTRVERGALEHRTKGRRDHGRRATRLFTGLVGVNGFGRPAPEPE
jgi:hypothetical protein